MITIDDFKKVEIRAGKIISAETVEGSEKLLKLSVDFGPAFAPPSPEATKGQSEGFGGTKQVLSGIVKFVSPADLVGITCAFVTNLEPREIMGLKSEAMIMAFSGQTETGNFFSLLKIPDDVPSGSLVR
jgi:methionyl-tRNA synthetase